MAFTSRQYRAIQYVADKNNWKLSLCKSPVVFFVDQAGVSVTADIDDVCDIYDQGRKEDLRAKKQNDAGSGYSWSVLSKTE